MPNKSKWETPWPGYFFKAKGYHVDAPVLVTPYDEEITMGLVDAIPYDQQYIRALQVRIKELEIDLERSKSAPLNVVAFSPYLRRREYAMIHRPAG